MSVLAEEAIVRLTPRQGEFLTLFAAGSTQREIASACFISQSRVRDALIEAQERLGAENMRQAIVKAFALGIILARTDGGVELVTLVSISSQSS